MNPTRHFPSLNGWRAVAILLVLGSHIIFLSGCPPAIAHFCQAAFDGELGVRFFFTISGFLITWLMLSEEEGAGQMSPGRFYARRAVRILPVYLACLLVLAALQYAGICSQPWYVWAKNLTFTRNFHQTANPEFLPSAHLWSLSVEEQFYMMWPLGFLLLRGSPAKRIGFLAGVATFAIGWNIISLLGFYDRHVYFLFASESTLMQMDCLAYGCLGAILVSVHETAMRKWFEKYALPIFLLSCALILIPEICGLGRTVQAMAFTFLLLQSILLPQFPPFRLLNLGWMAKIGILSYSIYIWQELVLLFWPFPAGWYLALPAVLVVAALSYSFLEMPFLALRRRLRAGSKQ